MPAYIFLQSFIVYFLFSNTAFAGAWPLSKGQTQTIQTMSFQQAKIPAPPPLILITARGRRLISKTGPIFSVSTALERTLWAETGLTPRLTAIAEFYDKRFSSKNNIIGGEATRIRHIETGLRYTFWKPSKNSVLSFQASVLSPSVTDGVPYDDFDRDRGGFDIRFLAGISFSFFGRSGFLDIQRAYRWHTNRYREKRLQVTLGFDLKETWRIFLEGEVIKRSFSSAWPSEKETKLRFSLVKTINAEWSLQMGQRFEMIPRASTHRQSWFLSLWRRF